ncbi:hypothetical protein Tco_0671989 [Tanacetum coccineum]
MLSILEFEERQSNDRTRILVNTLDSEFSTLEIHYSNTWVMLRSQLLKERLHKTDRLKQCKIDSSKVREDTNADDADIRPIYDEEPMAENDTVSSCSISKVQEKTQLSRIKCMKSLRAIQSQLKFLTDTLQDFGTMPIFKRTFSQDLDLLENHLTKEIISQTDCKTTLTKLRTTFENAFNSELKARMQNYTRYDAQSFYDAMIFNMDSLGKYMLELILHQQRTPQLLKQKKLMQTQEDHSNPIPALNVDSLKVDLVVIQNTCSEKEDSNSETASNKLVKECSLNSETKDVHAIKYKMSKAKERCMSYFRSLHSHLQVLSKDDLKGTRIEYGFKRAFMSLFGQDVDTFTSTMLLNVDQLQKQLDKDEFQEDGSMAAFWVVNNQFQKFINSKFTLDYDSQMIDDV